MKEAKRLVLVVLMLTYMVLTSAQINDLPRAIPEEEGVESRAIKAMLDKMREVPMTEIHHVMVVRHGKVLAEVHPTPFDAEYGHTLYSASKSFVSLAVGIAIGDNRLRLEDRVATFFPESLPDSVSAHLAEMTVRDLLTMTSGITPDWTMRNVTTDWEKTWLGKTVGCKPGTKYQYDSMCTYMLSAIVQRATGKKVLDLLKERVFGPQGINEVDWEESPSGVNTGGWGLRLQAESLAKFGLLMLHRGEWNGQQLVPASWIEAATAKQMSTSAEEPGMKRNDGNQGYGYQFWRCEYPGAYRADGALAQFVVMVPEKDLVVVVNANCVRYGWDVLSAVWHELMPGVKEGKLKETKDYNRLKETIAKEQLQKVRGTRGSKFAEKVIGKKLLLPENEYNISWMRLTEDKNHYKLEVADREGAVTEAALGYKEWLKTETDQTPTYSISPKSVFKGLKRNFVVAGNYGWTRGDEIEARTYYVNWVSKRTYSLSISSDGAIMLRVKDNYNEKTGEAIRCEIAK